MPLTRKRIGCRNILVGKGARNEVGIDGKALIAIATAHHWHRLLEDGTYRTYRDLAEAEKVHHSYVWRMLKLVFLAPSIVRDLLDGRQPSSFSITEVLKGMPLSWADQRRSFGFE